MARTGWTNGSSDETLVCQREKWRSSFDTLRESGNKMSKRHEYIEHAFIEVSSTF